MTMIEKPTKVRHWVLFYICLMYMITYLSRVVISVAAPAIIKEFTLTKVQMGVVFSAFVFPYALFQLPIGMLGDKYGPRKVLSTIVLLWSIFTGATALAWNLVSLVVFRGGFPQRHARFFSLAAYDRAGVRRGDHACLRSCRWRPYPGDCGCHHVALGMAVGICHVRHSRNFVVGFLVRLVPGQPT